MKGDFSRLIFDPKKHYTSALIQQGRVLSDADWNAQQSMNQYRFETEAQDVIGRCGVPEDIGGFEISLLSDKDKRVWDIAISPGRIYVDGLLCELEESTSTLATELIVNADGAGIGVKVASLTPDGQPFEKYQWIEIFGKDLPAIRVPILEIDSTAGTLKFDADGFKINKDGVESFNKAKDRRVRRIITYITQPYYPNPNFITSSGSNLTVAVFTPLPALKLEKDKTYLVYIDVWQRHRTSLDDSLIREVALGGPDTTTRLQTVWQVKLIPVVPFDSEPALNILRNLKATLQDSEKRAKAGNNPRGAAVLGRVINQIDNFLNGFSDLSIEFLQEELRSFTENVIFRLKELSFVIDPGVDIDAVQAELEKSIDAFGKVSCSTIFTEWDRLTATSMGTLNARTQPIQSDNNPCLLPPTAGYQRLENQLYRVEIHQGGLFKSGSANTATFKWSRDNGSVVTAIEQINGREITVQTVGPDDVLGFANGQWVEIIDDRLELNGQPGELRQIANVNPTTRVITLQSAPSSPLSTNPEGIDKTRHPKLRRWDSAGALPISSNWIQLEGGIEVQLSEGTYKTGDYWLIPARTITGEIEWPPYEIPNIPIPQLPLGIKHHYCRLAILKVEEEQIAGITRQKLTILEDCRKLFPPLTKVKVDTGIHILEVSVLDANDRPVPLKNNGEIEFELLAKGLRIVCDRDIDPTTINSPNEQNQQPNPVCFVTLDLPFPIDKRLWETDTVIGYQPTILAADVNTDRKIISWTPLTSISQWLNRGLKNVLGQQFGSDRILAHLTLKGNFIWAADDPKIYLDGEAYGTRDDETVSNLRLPSGDNRRGGNFEMWFWLAPPPPPRLVALAIAPNSVENREGSKGTVSLDKFAPEGGIEVNLRIAQADPNTSVTIPPNVRVAAGKNSEEFTINNNSNVPNNLVETVEIAASWGTDEKTAQLTIKGMRLA